MKRLFLVLLIAVMAVGGILSGCAEPTPAPPAEPSPAPAPAPTPAPPAEPTPKYGGTLKALWEPIPPTIGWPLSMIANPTGSAVMSILETLLRADKNGDVYGWLAESYEVDVGTLTGPPPGPPPDGEPPEGPPPGPVGEGSITFKLREGIKFHDGSDFNAEVVKWNLDLWIDARAQPFWKSVDIIDEYTVRVNLNMWRNTVPLSFCEGIAPVFMISKQAFDTNGLEWVQVNPVGTGPFIFESFVPDVSLKAVKNPDYWVEGKPYLDAIETIFSADPVTSKMVLQAGDVDMGGTSLNDVAEYEELGFDVFLATEAIWVLVPDTANHDSPWANQKVREAVEYAIDKESIAENLGYGYLEAPYQIAPRSSTVYDPNFSWERKYDPDKAKQLLAEAGYPDGFDTTIIIFPPSGDDYILAVQAYLSQVGIKVDLEHTDFGKWVTYMGPGSWPENSVLYSPIPRFDGSFLGGIQFTFMNFGQSWERTPEAMQAVDAALGTLEYDIEALRAVVDLIARDAMLIPVHEGTWNRVTAPYAHTEFDERGYILFWDVEDAWLDK